MDSIYTWIKDKDDELMILASLNGCPKSLEKLLILGSNINSIDECIFTNLSKFLFSDFLLKTLEILLFMELV